MFNDIFMDLQNGNDVRGSAIGTEKEKLTLTPDIAEFIAAGFLSFLTEKTGKTADKLSIGIGHDSRLTGEAIASAAAKGLGEASVYDCGMVSTPAMFRSTVLKGTDFDAAIMITASHLPFNRNGMKFFTKEGGLEHDELTDVLRRALSEAEKYGSADSEKIVSAEKYPVSCGKREKTDLVSLYCEAMREIIINEVAAEDREHPLKGLHIVVDAGNGAAGFFTDRILAPLGADTSGSVFLDPDGTFPNHVPNPENPAAMDAIKKAVLDAKADLGVIFDCDGDRGAVVFSDGTEVNRNTLIALLSVIVAEREKNAVIVTDSVTSDELTDFLENKLGLTHLRYKRGYKNVIDKGIELNREGKSCPLAIETSGHGAFRDNYFSDDGAYLSVMIICRLARMKREGKELSSLIADLKQPAEAREVRFTIVNDENDSRDYRQYGTDALEAFTAFAGRDPRFNIVTPNYEGVRIAFDDEEVKGWLLLRKSLHDPVMPLNLESEKKGGTDIIYDRLAPFLSKWTRLIAK
ncbi:MAG: phosphomannomutase/phosphoglucomutase [Oscillospiraceae bacterium]|nr:phosphomannomutase/phosphoglucomutase [Oscillospiraceae bacterium]